MSEAAPLVRRPGSTWKLALRIVVSGALLALVVSKDSSVDEAIPDQHGAITISLLVAAVLTALVGVVLTRNLVLAGHPRLSGRYAGKESWARFIVEVHLGVELLRREPRQILPVLGTSLIYQTSQVLMFGLIFRALDLPVPIAAVIAF